MQQTSPWVHIWMWFVGITSAHSKWTPVGLVAVEIIWSRLHYRTDFLNASSFLFQVLRGARQRGATAFVTSRTLLWLRPSSVTGSKSVAGITAIQLWSQFQTIPLEFFRLHFKSKFLSNSLTFSFNVFFCLKLKNALLRSMLMSFFITVCIFGWCCCLDISVACQAVHTMLMCVSFLHLHQTWFKFILDLSLLLYSNPVHRGRL